MKELNSELTFFSSYEQRMVVVSRNTGSAPLIGSKAIQDRASDGSVWSEKGPRNLRSDAKSDAKCVRSETDRTSDGVKKRLNRWPSIERKSK